MFIGHLVIEKLLKALCVHKSNDDVTIPKTHDLLILAEKAGVITDEDQKDLLDKITAFNISTRYPDYKMSFYNKCTKDYTDMWINEIKEMRTWLQSQFQKE